MPGLGERVVVQAPNAVEEFIRTAARSEAPALQHSFAREVEALESILRKLESSPHETAQPG